MMHAFLRVSRFGSSADQLGQMSMMLDMNSMFFDQLCDHASMMCLLQGRGWREAVQHLSCVSAISTPDTCLKVEVLIARDKSIIDFH